MKTHADKTQQNRSRSASNGESHKQSSSESILQLVDNRPEAVAQRKLHEMANNSPLAQKAAQLQAMVDIHSAQQQQPIQEKENDTGLPDNLRTGIEHLSGMSLDDVKVRRNSDKPAQLQAHAYAQGTDIHLARGQEKHLPHEAWHVVQQKQGRVKPTIQIEGKVYVNDDVGLEQEADVMGAKANRLKALATGAGEEVHQKGTNEPEIQGRQISSGQMKTDVVQKRDVVEDIVLAGYKKDKKKIKADLARCIDKFKTAIDTAFATLDEKYQRLSAIEEKGGALDEQEVQEYIEALTTLTEEMGDEGRDAFFYRSMFKKYKNGLQGDLDRFKEKWHVAETGGLLADIGLALKRVPMEIFEGGLSFDDIMPQYQQEGSDHVRGRGPDRSDWADDLTYSQLKGNAGPSSTTTQLLHVVSSIGGFSKTEVEAMMIALVKFWKGGIKRTFGKGHHTAVEVWAPYTGYLEAQDAEED